MQGVAKYYKDKIAHQKGSDIKRKEGLLRTKRIKSVNKYLASLGLGILFSFCIIIIIILFIYFVRACVCVCLSCNNREPQYRSWRHFL